MDASLFMARITWNPPREAFTIPYLQHPIAWYGIFFVVGLLFGYVIVLRYLRQELTQIDDPHPKATSYQLGDRLCWFVVLGTIIGARLGEVIFYDWDYYQDHLYQIVQIWKGGLSSHGAGIGIMLSLWLFCRRYQKIYPFITFLSLLDMIVIPTALAGFFIRIGNFFNQELIGTATEAPWGVLFLQPADGSLPTPRHPVQLYEAIAYLAIFFVLLFSRSRALQRFSKGWITGLFFLLVFSARFLLEFTKAHLGGIGLIPDTHLLRQGQLLSIPYILGGILLMVYAVRSSRPRIALTTSSKARRENR